MAERRGKRNASLEAGAEPETGSGSSLYGIPELMRRAISMGMAGFFFTEEAIRKALGETMPKDLQDFAIDQSRRTRADFLERLSYEIGRALENVDLATVLAQLLEGRTLEVKASIRLRDDAAKGGAKPRFRVQVEQDGDAE